MSNPCHPLCLHQRLGKRKAQGPPTEEARLWKLEPPSLTLTLTLGIRSNHLSFREPKGRMELQDHPGLLDHLGPGALLVTLEKMAPEECKAQR